MKYLNQYPMGILWLLFFVSFQIGCFKASQKRTHEARAERLYLEEKFDAAEVEYLNVLQLVPRDPHAVARLGLIYHAQGRYLRSLAYLKRAVKDDDENLQLKIALAKTSQYLGDRQTAWDEARGVLKMESTNQEAILLVADSAIQSEELQFVRAHLKSLASSDQQKENSQVALGVLLIREGKMTEAKIMFNTLISKIPDSVPAYLALGSLFLAEGDEEQAGLAFKRASEYAPSRSPQKLYYSKFLFNQGKVNEAKEVLHSISESAPDYVPVLTSLARIAFAEGDYQECNQILQRILSRDSGEFDALLLDGAVKVAQGDVQKAIAHYKHMISTAFDMVPQVHYVLALAYLKEDSLDKAMVHLNRAIRLNADHTNASLLLSELNVREGNLSSAILSLKQLTNRHPEMLGAFMLLAEAYIAQENTAAALSIYDQMLTHFPDAPQVRLSRGNLLVNQGQFDAAREDYHVVLDRSPKSVPVLEKLIDVDLIQRDFTNAMQLARNAVDQMPDAAEPYMLIAKVQLAQNDYPLAEHSLKLAIQKNGELQMPYILLARIYVQRGEIKLALKELNALVSRQPDNIAAWLQMAVTQDQHGLFEDAKKAYEKVLELDIDSIIALNNLAYLYSEHFGDLERARNLAERARRLAPYDPSTADTLGWILYKQSDFKQALALIRTASDKLTDSAEIQFHLGMTYYMLGNRKAAQHHLLRARDSKVVFAGKNEIAKRLEILSIKPEHASPGQIKLMEDAYKTDHGDPILMSMYAEHLASIDNDTLAIAVYERLHQLGYRSSDTEKSLALVYEKLGDLTLALKWAKEAYNSGTRTPDLNHLMGRLVFKSGDFEWAHSLLAEAKRGYPRSAGVQFDLAWSYYSLGNESTSVQLMNDAIGIGMPPSKEVKAKHFVRMIQAKDAQSVKNNTEEYTKAQKWLDQFPDHVPSQMLLGAFNESDGRFEEAVNYYQSCLNIFPDFIPAAKRLALIFTDELEKPLEGYKWAVQAHTALPEDWELTRALGKASFHKGDYDWSLQLLNECLSGLSNHPEVHFYIGKAHFQMEQPKEGKLALKEALTHGLAGDLAHEAEALLSLKR